VDWGQCVGESGDVSSDVDQSGGVQGVWAKFGGEAVQVGYRGSMGWHGMAVSGVLSEWRGQKLAPRFSVLLVKALCFRVAYVFGRSVIIFTCTGRNCDITWLSS